MQYVRGPHASYMHTVLPEKPAEQTGRWLKTAFPCLRPQSSRLLQQPVSLLDNLTRQRFSVDMTMKCVVLFLAQAIGQSADPGVQPERGRLTHVSSKEALPLPILVHQHGFLMVGKPKPLLHYPLYALPAADCPHIHCPSVHWHSCNF